MKNTFLLSIVSLFTIIIFNSCEKECDNNEIKNTTLNIAIAAGTTYKLDLSKYGDADDLAKITAQATNYTTSEIDQTTTPGTYSFLKSGSPKVGGNGNDVVILKIYEPEGRRHHDETNITINFTIL